MIRTIIAPLELCRSRLPKPKKPTGTSILTSLMPKRSDGFNAVAAAWAFPPGEKPEVDFTDGRLEAWSQSQ